MEKKRLKGVVCLCVFLVVALFAVAEATKLTFDISNPLPGNGADIGRGGYTTVYGDFGAAGSDGSTYSYGGVAADTPNIHVDYGQVRSPELGTQMWWSADTEGEAMFYGTGYEHVENVVSPWGNMGIIMFEPNEPGYAVTIDSLDVSTWNGSTAYGIEVQVWESIGNALDIDEFGGWDEFVENIDYNVLYSATRGPGVTDQHFDINVASNNILWLCVWASTGNSGNLALDNIVFHESLEQVDQLKTCAEVFAADLGEVTDLDPDCHIGMGDLYILTQVWLNDNNPE